jgi:hypothetical protein
MVRCWEEERRVDWLCNGERQSRDRACPFTIKSAALLKISASSKPCTFAWVNEDLRWLWNASCVYRYASRPAVVVEVKFLLSCLKEGFPNVQGGQR